MSHDEQDGPGFELLIDPDADQDVLSIWLRRENERPGSGEFFLEQLNALYDQLEDNPFVWVELRTRLRRAIFPRLPYLLFYTIDGDRVIVLTVLHQRQNPSNWP